VLLRNTVAIAVIGMVGTLVASTLVAYGLSRFQIPFKKTIFFVLIGTIILPPFVKLVPTYALFYHIGWVGTWLPLIVPHFFSNAYNVFLLRQYFLTIPRELDEAATIDGAGPLRTLWSVILPQAKPALVAVGLFHFFFAWNDFFEPMVYLSTRRDLQPISVGLQVFNSIYDSQPHLVQAGAMLALAIPVVIFFLAQRFFLRGIDFSGVQK
jgi:multiple sugar transport system permease protein